MKRLSLMLAAHLALVGAAAADAPGLTAEVKAAQEVFKTDEPLRFLVTLANQSKEDIVLPISEFLGSQSAGKFTPLFRNVATGEKWQFQFLPSRAPVRLSNETIKPGGTLELKYVLPGSYTKEDGTRAQHLPVGKYALALTIEVNGQTLTPKPAAFAVVEAPPPKPLAKEEMEKVVAQARRALAEKLARQAEATKGQPQPGSVDWSALKVDQFATTIETIPAGHLVKFSGDVPNTDQVVLWSVSVTDKGVAPGYLMQGFIITSKRQSPVPVRPPPLP